MNLITATAKLSLAFTFASGQRYFVAAAAGTNGIPHLEGATMAKSHAPQDNIEGLQSDRTTAAAAGERENAEGAAIEFEANADGVSTVVASGYTHSIRIEAHLPLKADNAGGAYIDRCVEWMDGANGSNFTWYGLRIQIPDDATTGSGRYIPAATLATKELGLVQGYNSIPMYTLLEYNITTSESQPTIRVNFNDLPLWDSYTFDFVEGWDVAEDGSGYQEFDKTMPGAISCYATPASESSRIVLVPVIPTLTISMTRPPTPNPTSAAIALQGTKLNLSFAVATALLALTFL
ncbi:hypothetical protein ACHAWF_010462 [Thalassiosira exigua]